MADETEAAPDRTGQSFFDKVLEKAADLSSLTIQTIVGDFTVDENNMKILATPQKSDSMLTRIDLIDGDITTAMSTKFLEGDYKELREFHAKREQEGRDIIKKNIETLETIAKAIINIQQKSPKSDEA